MKRIAMVACVLFLCACGEGFTEIYNPASIGDEPSEDRVASDSERDEEVPLDEQEGEPADDLPVGEAFAESDPGPADDRCIDGDDCPDGMDVVETTETTETTAQTGDDGEDSDTAGQESDAWIQGAKLITLRYAALRNRPSEDAGKAAIHPGSGAHGGHPRGVIPPGQRLTLRRTARTNGFYEVDYRGTRGWVHRNKLALWDDSVHPVKFARRRGIRDAFFMHQIRRGQWNKDGPYSSANCAPTSLAMAAKIFGKGGRGKTVEQSIHEARNSYGASSNENDGTSRSEIVRGAKRLGLDVQELGTNLSLEAEMDRIDKQLGWNRVVVLEGRPGPEYRSRMSAAFRNHGTSRRYTFAANHSILVVARFPDGKYLVADPISEAGMVTMSRGEVKSFFRAWGGTGTAVFDRDWNE